jgi:myo-inositol 2-dehydrogenase/D-chiro-inositol 1-dehydrogenase
MSDDLNVSRRSFLGTVGTAAAAGVVLAACSKPATEGWMETAPDGKPLKAGLIGCGGRGKGAAVNFVSAGKGLSVVALGDLFQDRLDDARREIAEKAKQQVADDKCFVGFHAFEKVLASGIDVAILATPPHFRPQHFAAAVAAGKHVFMEKPVAVDAPGVQSIIESAARAKTRGLSVVTGTQRRHQPSYRQAFERISNGAIGGLVQGTAERLVRYGMDDPRLGQLDLNVR